MTDLGARIRWRRPRSQTLARRHAFVAIAVGPNVKRDFASSVRYTHGSMVKSVEAFP